MSAYESVKANLIKDGYRYIRLAPDKKALKLVGTTFDLKTTGKAIKRDQKPRDLRYVDPKTGLVLSELPFGWHIASARERQRESGIEAQSLEEAAKLRLNPTVGKPKAARFSDRMRQLIERLGLTVPS